MISNSKFHNRFIEGYKIKRLITDNINIFLETYKNQLIELPVDSARKVVQEVENLNDVQRFEYFEGKCKKMDYHL